jgi:flagellar hook-associated protein 1
MAALSTALNFARSSLSSVAGQTAIASQNVANAKNTDYSRKTALVTSLSSGSIAITRYDRAADKILLDKLLNSSSGSAASNSILDGIKKLAEIVGDPQSGTSPASMLGKLQTALQVYEQNPADQNLAGTAVQAAGDIVRTLNDANATIQSVRKQADSGIAEAVDRVNNLLQQFKVVNDAIVRGDSSTANMVENLDSRDKIIKLLSDEMGIRTVTRANNDIALYTESGVTLFETVPRTVSVKQATSMTAGTAGAAVYVDGVDVSSVSSSMPLQSGNIFGLAKLRDGIAVTYQTQIDEFSRGLIEAFSEADQSAVPTLPNVTGLFSYSGSPAVPASGVAIAGLSGDIRLNAVVDPAQGGVASRLRDGGINGAAYNYNTTAASGFSGRISTLVEGLDAGRSFDVTTELAAQSSLKSMGSASSGWLQALQQTAAASADLQTATKQRSADALQRTTGVSIDEEMSSMLELERSYQAAAKLISTVDQMIQALLGVVK